MEKEENKEKCAENDMLAKKIKGVKETVAELKSINKGLENSVKETKAENDYLKSQQNLVILNDKSKEVKETTDQEDGQIENQCSKCNFL